ncbi:Aspartyl/glutamyl-tRNA(Asn/Gln) amidotransferase subunit C [Alphaproteobacteria bacterium]
MDIFGEDGIKKIADLACISLSSEEISIYRNEISGIVQWMETLKTVNTEGVEPMHSVIEGTTPLRADVIIEKTDSTAILANAPKIRSQYFVVPKVVNVT